MQEDFHYYATYCAAYLAGFEHDDCMKICWSAQFVDLCSASLLSGIGAPKAAATTQLSFEMLDARTDRPGLQDITRIWASFHFLPYDLYAKIGKGSKRYKDKYRMICRPNGTLVSDTVALAKGGSLQAAGIAMHVLADTWAHMYFAGTPSLVINNTNSYFYEILPDGRQEHIKFVHATSPDDLEKGKFTGSIYQSGENNIMNLGHGRAGHLPDYSFIKYKYLPAWGGYEEVIKDNPEDYYNAFCQMVYALGTLRNKDSEFERDVYAFETVAPLENEIRNILTKRQVIASDDWKALGERLCGKTIEDFDPYKYKEEYQSASKKDKHDTFLGRFIDAALAQKNMVASKIAQSGSKLAGIKRAGKGQDKVKEDLEDLAVNAEIILDEGFEDD